MIVRINIVFKDNNLRSFFLTETILKTVLKKYGFTLINFIKIDESSYSLIFETVKSVDEEEISKVLNCFPDSDNSLGIIKYGWTFSLVPYEVKDSSFYVDKMIWSYKHGNCIYRLKYNS